jgi:hypothetical protein
MAQPFIGREDAAPDPPDGAHLTFARVERLIGEEQALLEIPAHRRSAEQHDRLRAIGRELDRLWATLRERADRLGHQPATGGSGG